MLTTVQTIVLAALTIVVGILTSYLKSFMTEYGKKKGEIAATHEDIRKLVEQVAAVTKTQEDIKAAISDQVWSRQRQWELKKEIILTSLDKVSQMRSDMTWLSSIYTSSSDPNVSADLMDNALKKFMEIEPLLVSSILRVQVVCSGELATELDDLARTFRTISDDVIARTTPEALNQLADTVQEKMNVVVSLIRAELGVDKATSRCSPEK